MSGADELSTEIFTPETAFLSMRSGEENLEDAHYTKAAPAHKVYAPGTLAVSLVSCRVNDSARHALVRVWEKMSKGGKSADWLLGSVIAGFSHDIDAEENLEYPIGGLDQRFSPNGSREVEAVLRPLSATPVQSQLLREQSVIYDSLVNANPRFKHNIHPDQSGVVPFMRLPVDATDEERQEFFERYDTVKLPTLVLGSLAMKFESV